MLKKIDKMIPNLHENSKDLGEEKQSFKRESRIGRLALIGFKTLHEAALPKAVRDREEAVTRGRGQKQVCSDGQWQSGRPSQVGKGESV